MLKRLCCLGLLVLMLIPMLAINIKASEDSIPSRAEFSKIADALLSCKKSAFSTADTLLTEPFLRYAGTTEADWYPFAMKRLEVEDQYDDYLAVLRNTVELRYQKEDLLDATKSTEWHRIALVFSALGVDPQRIGNIDLLMDGVWNRVDENGNGLFQKQGINAYVWGLIAVDSLCYREPQNAFYTRSKMISFLLSQQRSDGGWALGGQVSDVDMTAMVLQALAPYQNSEIRYTDDEITVKDAIDKALLFLDRTQNADGSFSGWGRANCGSTAQVAIALSSLGIDLFRDARFISNGNTVWDALMRFRLSDGSFADTVGGKSDSRAGEQVLCAIAAISRFQSGDRRLYDLRPSLSADLREQISYVMTQIDSLSEASASERVQEVYTLYLSINVSERSYVHNYSHLSRLLRQHGIVFQTESVPYGSFDPITPQPIFDDRDAVQVDLLSASLTSADYPTVLRLLYKARDAKPFSKQDEIESKLLNMKGEIELIFTEVEELEKEIGEELSQIDRIGLWDYQRVNALYSRYTALSEYDRMRISDSHIEALQQARIKVNTALTSTIAIGVGVCAAGILLVILRILIRRRKELLKMPESDE